MKRAFQTHVLPESGPLISGAREQYRVGDVVDVNCTTKPSRPVTHLTWWVDNENAQPSQLHSEVVRRIETIDATSTTLRLTFTIGTEEIPQMTLTCLANIGLAYHSRAVHRSRVLPSQMSPPVEPVFEKNYAYTEPPTSFFVEDSTVAQSSLSSAGEVLKRIAVSGRRVSNLQQVSESYSGSLPSPTPLLSPHSPHHSTPPTVHYPFFSPFPSPSDILFLPKRPATHWKRVICTPAGFPGCDSFSLGSHSEKNILYVYLAQYSTGSSYTNQSMLAPWSLAQRYYRLSDISLILKILVVNDGHSQPQRCHPDVAGLLDRVRISNGGEWVNKRGREESGTPNLSLTRRNATVEAATLRPYYVRVWHFTDCPGPFLCCSQVGHSTALQQALHLLALLQFKINTQ
ncbi:hypothetical protein EVAR_26958_1 [Eumeta japonica]|uniref:Ig-like domain-containing protein n=1 Tax=Eumeta variegata TaxID=151549 RepID=A0A4C1VL88_EUMVA|nr:hypothetical protein EVAR_26958_1 [Eumeta japonica]